MLIPTLDEYENDNLLDTLWWNQNDFRSFAMSAMREITKIMKANPDLSRKASAQLLYSLKYYDSCDNLADPTLGAAVEMMERKIPQSSYTSASAAAVQVTTDQPQLKKVVSFENKENSLVNNVVNTLTGNTSWEFKTDYGIMI